MHDAFALSSLTGACSATVGTTGAAAETVLQAVVRTRRARTESALVGHAMVGKGGGGHYATPSATCRA